MSACCRALLIKHRHDVMGNRADTTTIGSGNRYSAFHGASISYGADGDVTQKYKSGSYNRVFYWSAESRLDSAMLDSYGMVRYDYNGLDKPVIKYRKISGGSWAVDSYFIWDGDQLLLELDASGNRRADYIYLPGSIDQPAAQTIGATSVTAIRDHRMDASGSVTGTVDGVAVSQQVSYDAWGTPAITGNADNRLLWKGLMWEGDVVSLYYARNRWYDPELGRFASEDPIGQAGGDNLYSFGGNDPVNASDPSGLLRCSQAQLDHGWKQEGEDCVHEMPPKVVTATPNLPIISWPVIPPEPPDPPAIVAFGGNGDFPGSGGGSAWTGPNLACRALLSSGTPVGGYYGGNVSYFIGYGLTGGAGFVWDKHGPGIYVRGGFGLGLQVSAGAERGLVGGGISGAAVEAEGFAASRSYSGSIGTSGGSVASGGRVSELPIGGHAAATFTQVWSAKDLCSQ